MTAADAITAVSAVIAALTFVFGLSAWRREFVGKRRIELAETVLAKFYETEEAICMIRSPFGWDEEGTSREPRVNEGSAEKQALDKAYVMFERYDKHRELFADLQSLKFRYRATFGDLPYKAFTDLCGVLNDMRHAANMLGTIYWQKESKGQLSASDVKEKGKFECTFRQVPSNQDEIAQRVKTAVQNVEELLQQEVRSQAGWWHRVSRFCFRPGKNSARGKETVRQSGARFTAAPS